MFRVLTPVELSTAEAICIRRLRIKPQNAVDKWAATTPYYRRTAQCHGPQAVDTCAKCLEVNPRGIRLEPSITSKTPHEQVLQDPSANAQRRRGRTTDRQATHRHGLLRFDLLGHYRAGTSRVRLREGITREYLPQRSSI